MCVRLVVAGKIRLDVRAVEVSPVALRLEAEHPAADLPVIADLAADGATVRMVRAFVQAAGSKSQRLLLQPQPPLMPM